MRAFAYTPCDPPAGWKREPGQAGDLAQHPLEAVEDLEHPLHRLLVLERMEVGDLRRAD